MHILPHSHLPAAQRGVVAVEFAIVSMVFFVFVFGTIEVARAFFLWSTMTEVTNRAARATAMTDFTSATSLATVRQNAMFVSSGGKLALGGGIDDSYLKIDYLQSDARTPVAAMPNCAPQNVVNCTDDPDGASCIRFVRARLCKPGTNCDRVEYVPLVALLGIQALKTNMPTFAAVAPAESLGMPAACP